MKYFSFRISKEDYERGLKDGAETLVNEGIRMGYGVYGAEVKEVDGEYWLSYRRGDSCN